MNNLPSPTQQQQALSQLVATTSIDVSSFQRISTDITLLAGMLSQANQQLQLALSGEQQAQLLQYLDTLLLWNKAYNLTAITQPLEAMVKHIIDCLAIVPTMRRLCVEELANQQTNSVPSVLDIGTGAGLPAVILSICCPELSCVPLDSNQKKIRFIRQVVGELKLNNITPIASRIEGYEGKHQLICSRAFASLIDFVQLAHPYLENNGVIIAMKGKAPTVDELHALTQDWHIKTEPLNVPFLSDSRHLVFLWQKNEKK